MIIDKEKKVKKFKFATKFLIQGYLILPVIPNKVEIHEKALNIINSVFHGNNEDL